MGDLARLSDDALTARLQHAAFFYLIDYANADTGLVADTSHQVSPCSIAVVGFTLSCYPIAVRNGWLSRPDAATRTLKAPYIRSRRARRSECFETGKAMAAGIEGHLWEMKDIAKLVEVHSAKPKRPATYRKRGDAATISN